MHQTEHSPPARGSGRELRILHVRDGTRDRDGFAHALKNLAPTVEILARNGWHGIFAYLTSMPIDLVVLESQPRGEDTELIRSIRRNYPQEALPIIVTAQGADLEAAYRAFRAGANDCLMQPLDVSECEERCRRALDQRLQYLCNMDLIVQQERRIEHFAEQLKLREIETLLTLARAANQRDNVTGGHLRRMAKYSFIIAIASGLSEEAALEIELAAPMHDIGKIGIPDEILRNKGELNTQQMLVMRNHTRIGFDILQGSASSFIQTASMVALHHHEKFDGSGYPMGLKSDSIPIEARIVALADVFDALTSCRPYKPAWEWDRAVEYIFAGRGGHFDPMLVDAFIDCGAQLRRAHAVLSDRPLAPAVSVA